MRDLPDTPAEDFRRNGYAVMPGALTDEELSMLREICDTLLAEPVDDESEEGIHKIGQGNARRFLRHRHEDFPPLAAFLTSPRVKAWLEEITGQGGFLFNEQFVVKGAKTGGTFAWHQDGAYVGFDHAPYLSLWMAVDDATEENGCVYILPRDLDAEPGIDPHEKLPGSDELNGYTGDSPGVAMTCKAGTIVAFSSLTLHRSGANTTENARRAYLAQFSPEPLIVPETGKPKRFAKPVG